MVSTRAAGVAEVLFELKRANKIATLSAVAQRAGFPAGSNNRTIKSAMKHVRRDWPHLQWWRAISDDGLVEGEQVAHLKDSGFEAPVEPVEGKKTQVKLEIDALQSEMMNWNEDDELEPGPVGSGDGEEE